MVKQQINEELLKELVSQVTEIKPAAPEPVLVTTDKTTLVTGPTDSKKRKKAIQPYEAFLTRRYDVKNRGCVYIDEGLKNKLERIVNFLSGNGLSLANYLDNVIEYHLSVYEEDINELYRKTYNSDKII